MPVRLRITALFGSIVFVLLALVCGAVFYFYYTNREHDSKRRLTNRAITTARLMQQPEIFDPKLIQKIDSSTAFTMKEKIMDVYDQEGNLIYHYSDLPNDTLSFNPGIIDEVQHKKTRYFKSGEKDAIAYSPSSPNLHVVILTAAYDEEGLAKLAQLKIILWACFFGGVVAAFVAGYIFSERLLRPVRKITDDIKDISARNLARRINTGVVRDEWFYLSDTLNQLLNRLQESFEIQRRFIANASHELSTPLTAISSQLEVSLQKNRGADEYRNTMESVYQDVQYLSKLTQTLLEFAQASGDAGGLEIEQLRIDEILMQLPATVRKLNEAYSVSLAFDDLPEKEEQLIVSGNSELLFSAIKNLVSNACKYSSDHKAFVKLMVESERIIITISDNGKGIPEADLPYIFQPFYRGGNTWEESGFGLGLSLCSRIIKLHKGEMSVSSEAGKGSVFTISLPTAGKIARIS
ncbi:HAMP domain-containing histidine kinase [Pseudoflavitalea sp. G-6-1-2]|nr:HAMP domain-containing histidine kinase [Pseudoflavitalea sp. G-6-1-2]